jgi:PKD repeat protein
MTRFLSTWRGWLFAIFTAVFLTACDPVADIVVPPQVAAGVAAEFKSQLFPANVALADGNLQYSWDFGDGGTGTGATAVHTYATPGTYDVTLSISDDMTRKFGQAYISKAKVTVVAAGATAPLVVSVMTADDQPIQGAQVTVGGVTSVVAEFARARFANTALDQPITVRVTAPGYVSTSVQLAPWAAQTPTERLAVVRMMPLASAQVLEDIAAAGPVSVGVLNATVALPANGFVNAKGEPAAGAASIIITPWDITRAADMAAFPGSRQARSEGGAIVKLISFGMMDVQVVGADGSPLQLAPGKTAQISMDLPTDKDEQGQPLAVGDTIPLWHFDEAQGLWVREGTGKVVASSTSASGLGVSATVGHFSSWNWDRVQPRAGDPDQGPIAVARSTTFRCVQPADAGGGVVQGCVIMLRQTLPNGSVLADDLSAPLGEVYFDRLVSTAAVNVRAVSNVEARRGSLTAQSGADIPSLQTIVLGAVRTTSQVPVVRVPALQIQFKDFPQSLRVNAEETGSWLEIISMTFERGGVMVDAKGVEYGGLVLVKDALGQEFLRVQSGAWAWQVTPGLPGALSLLGLDGRVTVKANIVKRTSNGQGASELASDVVTLTTHVDVPVLKQTGPLLFSQDGDFYQLWADFPRVKAIEPESRVAVRYQLVDGFGLPDGEVSPWMPAYHFDGSVDIPGAVRYNCGPTISGWYALTFEVEGLEGVTLYPTNPAYLNYGTPVCVPI